MICELYSLGSYDMVSRVIDCTLLPTRTLYAILTVVEGQNIAMSIFLTHVLRYHICTAHSIPKLELVVDPVKKRAHWTLSTSSIVPKFMFHELLNWKELQS